MTREEAIEIFKNMLDAWDNYYTIAQSDKKREAVWLAISSLETDEAYQLEYERTTKNNLGVDCISREKALDVIRNLYPSMPRVDFNGSLRKWVDEYKPYIECEDAIEELPSVTPQEPRTGHCKDCKWWKDSDGVYRRGIGAESKCPINHREVFEGNGYCYIFEPQESEDQDGQTSN